ncbi:MAG: nucleoside recognition protein [Clostridia bacterium]|nr:nucleoside recognition protein [Clostridia bacterium]
MLVIGIVLSLAGGDPSLVTSAAMDAGKEAVNIALTMCAVVPIWCGMMKIAEKTGLLNALTRLMYPIIGRLFPEIPAGHAALGHISANIAANIFGLGWAATPSGIAAMESLSELNGHRDTASKSMCMFMVINMSSVQLITVSILAYRLEYGSLSPEAVVFPGIIATTVSTAVGIVCVKLAERCVRR